MPDPYDLAEILEDMTLDLINSMKRNLKNHQDWEVREGFKWEQWQRAKLRNLERYRRENSYIVDEHIDKSEDIIEGVLEKAFRDGEARVERGIAYIFETDLKIDLPQDFQPRLPDMPRSMLPESPRETSFFGINERKLNVLKGQVHNDVKQARTPILRKMDDVYRQTIYRAEVNVAAGAKTINQAVDMATKDFLQKGINVVEYVDGRKVTITAYAEMALRTANQRATFLGEGQKRDEFGVYTVLMSQHNNCSPMCLPFQGTVMIDDVYTNITKEKALELQKETGYVLLSYAMEQHAFHPNCRHTLSTFFPGVNTIPEPVNKEEALENYEAEQWQRYLERGVRMYRRLYEGSTDEVNERRYKNKFDEWRRRLRDHIAEHDHLRRDTRRERVS